MTLAPQSLMRLRLPAPGADGDLLTVENGKWVSKAGGGINGPLSIGDITGLQAALDLKADSSAVNAALALKADSSAVNAALALKADASALALKADVNSPTFAGNPRSTTPGIGDNSTRIATTAFVMPLISGLSSSIDLKADTATVNSALALKADLASPAFSGVPTVPTAAPGTSTLQAASTAFVTAADNLKANIASPTLTGVPAAPTITNTAAGALGTTQIATTEFALKAFCCDAIDQWDDHLASTTTGSHGWVTITAGTGALSSKVTVAGRSGTVALTTGTTATGRIHLGHETTAATTPTLYRAGTTGMGAFMMEAIISVETLSTVGVEQFTCAVGVLRQGNIQTDFSDGVALVYDSTVSAQWFLQSRTGNVVVQTVTTNDPAATVTTGFIYLRIEWDETNGARAFAGPTMATAVLVGSIPAANVTFTQPVGPSVGIRKSVGVTPRRIIEDQRRFRAVMKGR